VSSRKSIKPGDATQADVTGAAGRSTIPADSGDASAPLTELPRNERRYAIVGEHKAGGQGRILEAEDRWLHRRVALKAPLGQTSGSEARFVREAMVTARMQHPAIVPVYDAGRDEKGRPFFAMKLVQGSSLRDVIAKRTTLDERLALLPNVIGVVEAIAYAHSQGVIHRDLKPSNVLIGPFGETVVIDWGLAKTLDDPDDVDVEEDTDPAASRSSSDLTRQGDIVGTPQYMAPEQAAGQAADERADVYALGAMLYELLSGDAPYPVDSGKVLEAVVAGPPSRISTRQPGVPEDLAAIVDKAMARRREDRYPTAAQLVDDLQRFQTGRLLASRRYSAWQRAQRWVLKHRALVAFLVLLVATIAIAGWRVVGERNRARDARDLLLLAQARQAMMRDPTLALAWLRRYPKDGAHAAEARALAMDAVSRGVAWRVWAYEEDHETLRAHFSDSGKQFVVNGQGRLHLFDVELGRASPPYDFPDGKYFASDQNDQPALTNSLSDPFFKLWGGQDERKSNAAECTDGTAAAVSDDDRWSACGRPDLGIELRENGVRVDLQGHTRKPAALEFSRDGTLLGSVSDRTVRIWKLAPLASVVLGEIARDIVLSPDGHTLAALREGHGLVLLDLGTGKVRGDCSTLGGVRRLAWSADSKRLAVATDRGLRVLDATACTVIKKDESDVIDLAWEPHGTRLATVAKAGGIKLWQPSGEFQALPGYYAVAFAEDGKSLATGGDLDVHVIDLAGGAERRLSSHHQPIQRVAFAGGHLVSSAPDGLVLWDAAGKPIQLASENARGFEFSPDGRWLAAAFDGAVRIYDLAAARGYDLVGATGRADHVHFSTGGEQVGVASTDDGAIRVWDVRTRRLAAVLRQQAPVRDLAFLPGAALLGAGQDGLRRFALTDAPAAPDDPAALAGWIDGHTTATLDVLAPESPIDLEDTH
jgi:WD40 repeat protein